MAAVYFARWLLLPDGTVLDNGVCVVEGGRIVSVGTRATARRASGDRLVNLGSTLLLPGFINLHTHLEESAMRDMPARQGESFSSRFAKKNTRLRQADVGDLSLAARLCAREFLSNGITTVVDSSRRGVSPLVLAEEPLRSWVVHEVSPDDEVQENAVIDTLAEQLHAHPENVRAGVGPYSLFSLSPDNHRRLAGLAQKNNWLWLTHVAESAEELQAFTEQTGDLYFQLTRKKPWPFAKTPGGPMYYALTNNIIPNNAVCCQCNYVNGHEFSLLAAKHVSIATSLRYTGAMGHGRFALDVAMDHGVNVCMVTESVADSETTDLLDELYLVKLAYPHLPASTALAFITKNPAAALGMHGRLGVLQEGALADMVGFSFLDDPGGHVLDDLLIEDHEISAVVVNGEEVIANY